MLKYSSIFLSSGLFVNMNIETFFKKKCKLWNQTPLNVLCFRLSWSSLGFEVGTHKLGKAGSGSSQFPFFTSQMPYVYHEKPHHNILENAKQYQKINPLENTGYIDIGKYKVTFRYAFSNITL